MQRSNALDALRGLAIAMVVLHHYMPVRAMDFGWTGVDLFFVLSGYLIGGILIDNREADNLFPTFYLRRAARIIPLYAVFLAFFFTVFRDTADGPIWPFLVFAQNLVWASAGTAGPSMISVTWSLAVEEQFYLCLPLLIWFVRPDRLPRVLMGLIAVAPLMRVLAVAFYGNGMAPYYLLPCRMDALLLGVLAAWMVRQPNFLEAFQRRRPVLLTCLAIGLAGDAVLESVSLALGQSSPSALPMWTIGYTWIDLTYALLLLAVVTVPASSAGRRGPLSLLGLGAYSIYLFHAPVLRLALDFIGPYRGTLVLATVGTLGMAVVCWLLIERPLIRYGHRHWRYRVHQRKTIRYGMIGEKTAPGARA